MNLIENCNTYQFNFNSSYSLMDINKGNNRNELFLRNDMRVQKQSFMFNNKSNNKSCNSSNSKWENRNLNKKSINAMSLDAIVNNDMDENTTTHVNNYQQEKECDKNSNEKNLSFTDASRTLAPLTALTTQTTTSISISTLLNSTIAPSISSASSELSNSPSIQSYSLSPTISEHNNNNFNYYDQSDKTSNLNIRTDNTSAETSYNNDEESNQQISKIQSRIDERFFENNNNYNNNCKNNYPYSHFNDSNLTNSKNNNQNGK